MVERKLCYIAVHMHIITLWLFLVSDGVLENMSLASRILENIFLVLGVGLGLNRQVLDLGT